MDTVEARSIVQGQIEKHRIIQGCAVELKEYKMALEHRDIADALEMVLREGGSND